MFNLRAQFTYRIHAQFCTHYEDMTEQEVGIKEAYVLCNTHSLTLHFILIKTNIY
jgi:hypothetical protein